MARSLRYKNVNKCISTRPHNPPLIIIKLPLAKECVVFLLSMEDMPQIERESLRITIPMYHNHHYCLHPLQHHPLLILILIIIIITALIKVVQL